MAGPTKPPFGIDNHGDKGRRDKGSDEIITGAYKKRGRLDVSLTSPPPLKKKAKLSSGKTLVSTELNQSDDESAESGDSHNEESEDGSEDGTEPETGYRDEEDSEEDCEDSTESETTESESGDSYDEEIEDEDAGDEDHDDGSDDEEDTDDRQFDDILGHELGFRDRRDWWTAFNEKDKRMDKLIESDDVCQRIGEGWLMVEPLSTSTLHQLGKVPPPAILQEAFEEAMMTPDLGYNFLVEDTVTFLDWAYAEACGGRADEVVEAVTLPEQKQIVTDIVEGRRQPNSTEDYLDRNEVRFTAFDNPRSAHRLPFLDTTTTNTAATETTVNNFWSACYFHFKKQDKCMLDHPPRAHEPLPNTQQWKHRFL
ncbi:hypothetical protein PRZ48_007409 [Zasmidium cellare]|uniref:Uncharacterized protein n=1 Tax=Zasmidium cellare TaxID=395010 RepID=A0ABR0EK90_ZASCE|nr:hypothetical protein PRZ48_007409 [Zasmidium cellare]